MDDVIVSCVEHAQSSLIHMYPVADTARVPDPRGNSTTSDSPLGEYVFSLEEIRTRCEEVFKVRPCRFQTEFARNILLRKDVILEIATGMGKTLAFWLPILFRPTGIQVVVTALNALEHQCDASLAEYGILAVAIDGTLEHERVTTVFKVRCDHLSSNLNSILYLVSGDRSRQIWHRHHQSRTADEA